MARTVKCPYCDEEIQPNAKKCKHCGEWIDKATMKKAKKKADAEANSGSGCFAVVVAFVILVFLFRGCGGNNEPANVTRTLPTPEGIEQQDGEDVAPSDSAPLSTSASSQTESGSEGTEEIPVLSDEEMVRVRSTLNDHDLQETVYARCQEQGSDLFNVPRTADWPELRWGFFGNPIDGVQRTVEPEKRILQFDVEVESKDEYAGLVQNTISCLYDLPRDEVKTTLVDVREPYSYPVSLPVLGRRNTTTVWLYEVAPNGDSSRERFVSNSSTSGWHLKPGYYKFKVEDFWSKAETGRFKVPAKSYPRVQLQALPTVPVTFASTPPGVSVTLPDESVETTPFTVELPRDKQVEYKANYDGLFENRTKLGAINVAKASTIDVTLASPTVPVSFTSKPAGVNVTLPDESVRTTPFTIDLPENTTVEYDAEYKGQFERRSQSGEVNVSKASTIDVTLASPTVPVTFTSTPSGMNVTLPDNQGRSTPFTIDLPKNTRVTYRAYYDGASDYRSKSGALKVSKKTTYKVTLEKKSSSASSVSSPSPSSQMGAIPLTGAIYAFDQTEQIECSGGTLENLQDYDVYGVTCYFTTLPMQRAKAVIAESATELEGSIISYWSGWIQTESGWTADVENRDQTGAELYLFRYGGGLQLIAYALDLDAEF